MQSDRSSCHWRVLRNAILRSSVDKASPSVDTMRQTASSIATEFFQLYPKSFVDTTKVLMHTPAGETFAWMAYDLSAAIEKKSDGLPIAYVHEKRKDVKVVPISDLVSHHVNQGVDNTGNIRTWPSEQVLLSYMISSNVCSQLQQRGIDGQLLPIACCELGGGMAGLASLGLLVCGPAEIARIVVTDGNLQSVKNLQLCIAETKRHQEPIACAQHTDITAELLRWDRNATLREDLQHQFDLVFASDCLFFEEFHEDLAFTIKQLLRRGSGRCLLLQPSRNGSLERFCVIATRHGFSISQSQDYDPTIVRKHEEYQRLRPDYVPNVHFPILLTLTLTSNDR